ncbi:MAG: GDSL-type esterase/lipase family protein [Candidatus Woesearchaeota archaeon]
MTDIFVFGDSISNGSWADPGWADRIKNDLVQNHISNSAYLDTLINISAGGKNSSHILKFIQPVLQAHTDEHVDSIVIFAVGINDAARIDGKEGNWVNKNESISNMKKMIEHAKQTTQHVLILDVTPVDESKTNPCSFAPDVSYKNSDILEYSKLLRTIAKETNCIFIPLFDEWKSREYTNYLDDGLHPNREGHRRIYEKVKAAISPLLNSKG